MKCFRSAVIIFTFCLFLVPSDVYGDDFNKTQNTDKWIWGSDVVAAKTTIATEPSIEGRRENDEDPCDFKPLEKPDFRAPGRRISEEKCFEYLWNIKFREENVRQRTECERSTSTTPKPIDPLAPVFVILRGHIVKPGEFPHMGAIGWETVDKKWAFMCGSTLISSKYVLTAAHCTRTSGRDSSIADPVPKIVRMGVRDIFGVLRILNPHDENITRIIVHPKYSSPKKYFDIALMELGNKVLFSAYIQPACLWTNSDTSPLGTSAFVTGWGVVDKDRRDKSPDLLVTQIDVIDTKTCDDLLRPKCNRLWCGVQETQICAGKLAGGSDSCWGDSGGPLQIRINLPPTTEGVMHYVIGVTSFGFECGQANTPGVYTRVSSFVDWIESVVWAN